jgi:7-keto-8-aminopelargonate synthetase-like enzyme
VVNEPQDPDLFWKSQAVRERGRLYSSQFHVADATTFNSGYDANVGFFGSVPQKGISYL